MSYATLELNSGKANASLTMKVNDLEDTVVLVNTLGFDVVGTSVTNEGVSDHSVAGLEPDTRLEGTLTNRTNHL